MYDTVVVGGGVAGLTAALFAARAGCATLVLAPGIPGGQLSTIERVEDFPGFLDGVSGYELGPTIQEQAANAGAEFQMVEALGLEAVEGNWRVVTTDGEVDARTVILAMGSKPRELGVPGEERLRGRGVSHCASCDGPLLRGKAVIVVGAGDSGLQEALTLSGFASDVLVVHDSDLPSAQEVYRQRVHETPTIRLLGSSVIEEIMGDELVQGVRLRNLERQEVTNLETAAVFVYIGLEPNTVFLRDTLRLDEDGRIPTDIWMRTELAGVFAVGDVRRDSASQAITAAGDGATAAQAVRRYLDQLGRGT